MFGTPKTELDTEPIQPEPISPEPIRQPPVQEPVRRPDRQSVQQPAQQPRPVSSAPSLDQGVTLDEPQEKPEVYLARVQEKIHKLAEEFAAGSINQEQFQELFDHYRREQQAVKRWIEVAPDSDAWKDVTTEGKSVIIRAGARAKALGYAIYENESGMPLNTIGEFELEPELVVPMLSSYRAATREIFGSGMRSSQIEGGRWLCFVPGEFTTLMALFSTSPASRQLESLEELHRLFERANRNLLGGGLVDPSALVFPHAFFLGRIE
jgi:hypothetical protein